MRSIEQKQLVQQDADTFLEYPRWQWLWIRRTLLVP